MTAPDPEIRFYLLVCRVCSPDLEQVLPFGSAEERGKWAAEHTKGTGHDRWLVFETSHGHTPQLAKAIAALTDESESYAIRLVVEDLIVNGKADPLGMAVARALDLADEQDIKAKAEGDTTARWVADELRRRIGEALGRR